MNKTSIIKWSSIYDNLTEICDRFEDGKKYIIETFENFIVVGTWCEGDQGVNVHFPIKDVNGKILFYDNQFYSIYNSILRIAKFDY